MPFRFLEDIVTADVAFESWGATREEVFSSCAAALLATMVEESEEVARSKEIQIHLEHEELDLLLFALLNELVFHKDAHKLLLHVDNVVITERDGMFHLETVARGEEIAPDRHKLLVDVKAITLHRFALVQNDNLWKATVVVDV